MAKYTDKSSVDLDREEQGYKRGYEDAKAGRSPDGMAGNNFFEPAEARKEGYERGYERGRAEYLSDKVKKS